MIGKVKWFNDAKGYGFIRTADIDEDIFVHHSEIQTDGWATLHRGELVMFDVIRTYKGLQALEVQPVTAAEVELMRQRDEVAA